MKIKKISIDQLIFILLSVFMWLVFAFNTYNVDMPAYKAVYSYCENHKVYPGLEVGFTYLLHFFNFFHFTYDQFLVVYAGIVMFFIIFTINKYAVNKTVVLILYALYPFLTDIPTVRNYLAEALVLWGIHFLIKENVERKDLIKYSATIIVASLFHIVALSYLIFVFVFLDYNKIKKMVLILIGIEILSFFSLPAIVGFLSRFIPKLEYYIQHGLGGTQTYTKFFVIVYLVAMMFFERIVYDREQKLHVVENYVFHSQGLKILRLADVLILFSAIEMDFYRLHRNILLLFYMIICNYSFSYSKKKRFGVVSVIMPMMLLFVGMLSYVLLFMNSFESIVSNILQNNALWGK